MADQPKKRGRPPGTNPGGRPKSLPEGAVKWHVRVTQEEQRAIRQLLKEMRGQES